MKGGRREGRRQRDGGREGGMEGRRERGREAIDDFVKENCPKAITQEVGSRFFLGFFKNLFLILENCNLGNQTQVSAGHQQKGHSWITPNLDNQKLLHITIIVLVGIIIPLCIGIL